MFPLRKIIIHHDKLSPVKFMLSAAAATNGIPVLPPVNPLKFTVVTWCALLTRDLLVIANFLV